MTSPLVRASLACAMFAACCTIAYCQNVSKPSTLPTQTTQTPAAGAPTTNSTASPNPASTTGAPAAEAAPAEAPPDTTKAEKSAPAPSSNLAAAPETSTKTKKPPLGDYVPCIFDGDQSLDLRVRPQQLTSYQATIVANLIQASFLQGVPADDKSDTVRNFTSTKLTADNIQNLRIPFSEVPEVVQDLATVNGIDPKVTAQALAQIETKLGAFAAAQAFNRPPDVSCSFSILQRKETADTFGRRVADDYVALQVTVRNLNLTDEFLVHDIQIAIDTGLNPAQFGRFQAARDKLIVRSVAQRGQTEDHRNVIINVLQAFGAIAGGASAAVLQGTASAAQATDLGAAVAIFQGPFITGLINIFPDHTLEHLNHINDLAFSASSTSKTVVPIQGSAPLITFMAEEPLGQLPFARCGTNRSTSFFMPDDTPGASKYSFCDIPEEQPKSAALQPASYDKPFPFRRWAPAALEILEHRLFVVVSGVHIKETASQPTLSSITCTPTNNTTIDLSQIGGTTATCAVKGSDLDLLSQILLQNPTDSNDQATGAVSVTGGDNTQATVTFAVKDLIGLKATTYKVSHALKGAESQSTTLTVTVKPGVSMIPSSLDFGHTSSGAQALEKAITLINNTNAPLSNTTVALIMKAPSAAGTYTETHRCPASVQAGDNCSITVTFHPPVTAAPGTLPASLTVTYDNASHPISITAAVP